MYRAILLIPHDQAVELVKFQLLAPQRGHVAGFHASLLLQTPLLDVLIRSALWKSLCSGTLVEADFALPLAIAFPDPHVVFSPAHLSKTSRYSGCSTVWRNGTTSGPSGQSRLLSI